MNAIIKISGVSLEGFARLVQLLETTKVDIRKGNVCLKDLKGAQPFEDDIVNVESFRFVKMIEMKSESPQTYLVTLKTYWVVWDQDGVPYRFGRDTFLAIFRSIDEKNLPVPNNDIKIGVMMEQLMELEKSHLPFELFTDAKVVVNVNEEITIGVILMRIIPNLQILHWDTKGTRDARVLGLLDHLTRARNIAREIF